jgi:hypothetical protein
LTGAGLARQRGRAALSASAAVYGKMAYDAAVRHGDKEAAAGILAEMAELELLTREEREAVRMAGMAYTLIADHVVAYGPTRDADLAEIAAAVHVMQRAVLAQAAARWYRGEFRLLGGTLTPGHDPEDTNDPR